jgi:predicted transcriptional regulator
MNQKLILRAINAGCKTAADLARYIKQDDLSWLNDGHKFKTIIHHGVKK